MMIDVSKHVRIINGKKVNVSKHKRKPFVIKTNGKYPLQSSEKEIQKSVSIGQQRINSKLSKKQLKEIKKIEQRSFAGKGTHTKYSRNGKFFKSRKRLHDSVINKVFKDNSTIDKKDPDLYLLGGVAGSGKSSTLAKKIPEKVVTINSDDFKADLAKKDKSPLRKYPLAHAGLLHEESSYLVKESLNKGRKERRDILLDATLGNKEKGKRIIKDFKKEGYDVHLLGTQIKPHVSIDRATTRFLEGKEGRYVPLKIIGKAGNKTNKSVISLRNYADSHIIMDTSTRPAKLVSKKGSITKNYR